MIYLDEQIVEAYLAVLLTICTTCGNSFTKKTWQPASQPDIVLA
jgi:hypothetical protein